MKTFVLLITTLLTFFASVNGQKTEITASFNSGFYSYSGNSVKGVTSILYDDQAKSGYTNGPFGSKPGVCYGVSINIKRVAKVNFIYGLDLGYEALRSKISIDRIDEYDGFDVYQYNARGRTFLNNNDLNFNPFIGYRFGLKNISFDLTGGFDFSYILKSTEKGSATASNGTKYSTSLDRKKVNFDFGPRIQISTEYKRFGIYVGYSYGLNNYLMKNMSDAVTEAYSRFIRLGFTYRVK